MFDLVKFIFSRLHNDKSSLCFIDIFILQSKTEIIFKDHVKDQARQKTEKGNIGLSAFKDELIEEIDTFWQNRVLNAQILIKDRAIELMKGEISYCIKTVIIYFIQKLKGVNYDAYLILLVAFKSYINQVAL